MKTLMISLQQVLKARKLVLVVRLSNQTNLTIIFNMVFNTAQRFNIYNRSIMLAKIKKPILFEVTW